MKSSDELKKYFAVRVKCTCDTVYLRVEVDKRVRLLVFWLNCCLDVIRGKLEEEVSEEDHFVNAKCEMPIMFSRECVR